MTKAFMIYSVFLTFITPSSYFMKGLETFASMEHLDSESKYLIHKAKEATNHAYAPYSKFFVGTAIILDDDTVVTGSNQENASYSLCMCAERATLFAASSTNPDKKINKIAVVAHRKNHKELFPTAPCGACRQVLLEYEVRQGQDISIVILGAESEWLIFPSAASLLPFAFSPANLK